MLSLFKTNATPALVVYLPPMTYASGSTVDGEVEVDFRKLQEDNIEEIHVRLRGTARTTIHRNKDTHGDVLRVVDADTSLWTRGTAYPTPGSDVLRLPFSFSLPNSLPPSFHYNTLDEAAVVHYALTATGVRKGMLNANRKHVVPIALLPRDEVGVRVKEGSVRGEVHGWQSKRKEEKIRKGLWGEYATVEVELSLPNIPVIPLFSAIPYKIGITTRSAPLARSKAAASASSAKGKEKERPIFPPVPLSADELEMTLRRRLSIKAKIYGQQQRNDTIFGSVARTDVEHFLGKDAVKAGEKGKGKGKASSGAKRPPVEMEVAEKEWVWADEVSGFADEKKRDANAEDVKENGEKGDAYERSGKDSESRPSVDGAGCSDGDRKGMWVQRATIHSTFSLSCPPTFQVRHIDCQYSLTLRVPFPGAGNDVRLELPITVTSGIDKPLPKENSGDSGAEGPSTLDLPPSYWDGNGKDWGEDTKE